MFIKNTKQKQKIEEQKSWNNCSHGLTQSFVSQNSKRVGTNEATEMPPSPHPPHYGNNLRINAPTGANKQPPVDREVSPDIHIYIVDICEDAPNPFSPFSHDSLCFPSKAHNKGLPCN